MWRPQTLPQSAAGDEGPVTGTGTYKVRRCMHNAGKRGRQAFARSAAAMKVAGGQEATLLRLLPVANQQAGRAPHGMRHACRWAPPQAGPARYPPLLSTREPGGCRSATPHSCCSSCRWYSRFASRRGPPPLPLPPDPLPPAAGQHMKLFTAANHLTHAQLPCAQLCKNGR